MKRVTEQLTAFHRAAGLEGEDLSVAVAADIRRVKRNKGVSNVWMESSKIDELFVWACTEEGYAYWEARNDADASV